MVRKSFSPVLFVVTSLLAALALAACGGGAAGGGTSSTAIPTNTPIPTYGIALPTSMLVVSTAESTSEATPPADSTAEATAEASTEATAVAAVSTEATAVAAVSTSLDPALVERGKGRYEALDCASCHGVGGAGTDQGKILVGLTQTEAEFLSFMRSGGTLGTLHQYPANRLSDSGAAALYQYLMSLSTGS